MKNITIGSLAIASSAIAGEIEIKPVLDILVQIAIAVATLVSLFKKKKPIQ